MPQNKNSYTKRMCMMDKRGEGVTLILNRSEALSGKRPEYRMLDSSELRVTIYGGYCQRRPHAFRQEKLEVVKAEKSDFGSDARKKVLIIG